MAYITTPQSKKTIEALWRLEKIILDSLNYEEVVQEICDSVLTELGFLELGYEIVVLNLIDPKTNSLNRVSISQTKKAKAAIHASSIPFRNISIPLNNKRNLLIKAIKEKQPQRTCSWVDILTPALSDEEILKIQRMVNIQASIVYPVLNKNKAIGALIFSMSKPPSKVTIDEEDLLRGFSDVVGLAVQNASLYSQLEAATGELKKANRHLKHLDKLKNDFIFVATHELKNPVTAMRGYVSMLLEGVFGDIPNKMKDPINQLQSSTETLVDLVNDLLQIARSEAKTLTIYPETINLHQTTSVLAEALKALFIQKGLKFLHPPPPQNLLVKADPQRLKEVINNLLSNAIKYSESGTITITYDIKDKEIITQVTDEGVGITPEDQAKLFTKFFRVAEQAAKGIPGTGLGLFIIKEIIEKMGGKIWVESKPGHGSTFSFSLPKAS